MPLNVLTAPISVSDPAGLTGAVVPLVQPTQPPATPIQRTDIIPHAAPLQTQPVMIPQHTIVQQQQIGMDAQTATIQQQPQQQMEAQVALLDQRLTATQSPMQNQPQDISAAAVLTHLTEPQQQIFAQQSVPAVHPLPEQKLLPAATGMEQPAMSLPLEQHQAYRSQPTADNYEQIAMMQPQQLHHTPQQQQALLQQHQASLYAKQQLDQQQKQQQQAFLQAQLQQQQVDQQQAFIQNKLLDQQQQQHQKILIQQQGQKQHQQAYLQPKLEQQQQELTRQQQQQPQSQLYQQCGQNLVGIQTDSDNPQQQQPGLQQQTHQTQQQQGLQQQQILMQQLQQHQLQQLQQQEQQQAKLKQQMEQQQQALLQQQLEHQKQLMFQQQQVERLQQQTLLQQQIQEQQHATAIHPHQSETGDAAAFPQSKSEQQIQQQFIEIQHSYIPQPNSSQSPICTTLSQQQGVGPQQHAAFIQKQQGFVGQPQLHSSSTESHIPVGAPPNTEVAQQKQIVSQARVAMTVQTPQIPQTPAVTQQGQNVAFPQGQIAAQFITQPAVHTASTMTETQVSLQRQAPTIQTQQISSLTTYPGTLTPTQNQVTAQELIQNQPLLLNLGQSQSQTGVQLPAAISSTHSQIQHETCARQNIQTSGLIQPHLHHQAFEPSVLQLQSGASHFTPQFVPQPTHSAKPSVTDRSYIPQPQQESVQQYQQMPPVSAGIVAPTTALSPPVTDPNIVATLQQARQTSTLGQAPVCPVTQVEQKSTGTTADPSIIEAVPQSAGQYKELQKPAQVQQPLAPLCPQPQLLSRHISTPTQQPHPPNQAKAAPPPEVTYPVAKAAPNRMAGPQSQDRGPPFYSDSAAGVPSSPQHQTKKMLPAHTHTQTSIQSQTHSQTQTHIHTQAHSHTQTHTETPASDQPTMPLAVFPASQMPLSPTHTSCPPTSLPLLLPSLPPYPPAPEALAEPPTSSPAAQVASPELADFMPTSPPPVTTLHSLESNVPKLPQASLQDCDPPLLGTAQVQEAGQFSLFFFLIILYINNTGIQLFGFLIHINKCNS